MYFLQRTVSPGTNQEVVLLKRYINSHRSIQNLFSDVLDFNWLRKEKSPNWGILSLSSFLEGHPTLSSVVERTSTLPSVHIDLC